MDSYNSVKQFSTPILFLIFNRPQTTKRVFSQIQKIQPKRLYIASDGPRHHSPEDSIKIKEIQEFISTNINWDCDIKLLYREHNLGCKVAVSSAIDWFFENEEYGIILEDDCLPDISFFKYCEDLLDKYKDTEKISLISGDQFLPEKSLNNLQSSYYFTTRPHIWGWATWRRTWEKYDLEMRDWPQNIDLIKRNSRLSKYAWKEMCENLTSTKSGKINTWDYQLCYSIWKHNGLCIAPKYNLISNIGFDNFATHTKSPHSILNKIPTKSLQFPLSHPRHILHNSIFDQKEDDLLHASRVKRIFRKLISLP